MKIQLPENVRKIIEIIEKNGCEAYAVGGCVRDVLLGRTPQDWDITTSALPEDVKAMFRRTVDTGIEHGTVTVMMNKTGYEVTTYRIDGRYKDARHPEQVTFTPSLEEDLKRRDFTINAMAYNERDGLIDLFSGQEDLENGVVRAVGDPEKRFTEDALRIMRCIRFSAQLGFRAEEKTLEAAKALSGNLVLISKERIRDELLKTLMSDYPEQAAEFDEIGAMPYIFPEFRENAAERVQKLTAVRKDRILRLGAFLYGLSGKEAEKVLRDLKLDNDTVKRTAALLEFSGNPAPCDDRSLRHLMAAYGTEDLERLLLFTGNEELIPRAQAILSRGECVSLKTLAITGNDLIRAGMEPGKEIGRTLDRLLGIVLDDPEMNRKEILIKKI